MQLKVVKSSHSLRRHYYEIEFLDKSYSEEEFIRGMNAAIGGRWNFHLDGKSRVYYLMQGENKIEDSDSNRYAEFIVTKFPGKRKVMLLVKKLADCGELESMLSAIMGPVIRENSLEEVKRRANQQEFQPYQSEQLSLFRTG